MFAVQCTHDFFGAYDVDADRGLVQWADHRELSGKKAWTWGEWEFGRVAEQDLTDEDGPYIEVQSGPLPTQSDYGRLRPRQTVAWREWWYPVHGLGDGFEFATRHVAINVMRGRKGVEVRAIATGVYNGATCIISQQNREIARYSVDLSPQKPVRLAVPVAASQSFCVEFRAKDGSLLAAYKSPLEIPKVEPPDPSQFREKPDAEKLADDFYKAGEKADLATDRRRARELYQKALEKDPKHVRSLCGLAVLDFEAGQYESALTWLTHALKESPDDPWSLFYAAASQYQLQNWQEAWNLAARAEKHPETAAESADLLGRIAMRRGDFGTAEAAFRRALQAKPDDPVSEGHLILALYAEGEREEALNRAASRSAQETTAIVPAWILVIGKSEDEKAFLKRMLDRLGEFEFEVLDAVHFLKDVGQDALATRLVQIVTADPQAVPKLSAMTYWTLAWLLDGQGKTEAAKQMLAQAMQHRVPKRFASRVEEIPVLKYVVAANPSDSHAWFQLGCLLAALGRVDEAIPPWTKAAELEPSNSVAWRNLGLEAAARGDLAAAEKYYRQAIKSNPQDQTLYRDLAELLVAAGRRSEAISLVETMPLSGVRRTDLTVLLAQMYFDSEQYDDCLRVLENAPYFTNWEGQDIVWRLFNRAHTRRGQQRMDRGDLRSALADFEAALTYPKNLHVGRSNKPIEAPARYWQGVALAKLGRLEEAKEAWQVGASLPSVPGEQDEYRQKCAEALRELPPGLGAQRIFLFEPIYRCFKIERDLELTGALDDPLWHAAPVAELGDPIEGKPARHKTRARLLYNDRYLYVAFECEDDFVWGTLQERDSPIYDEECVEVFLCPTGNPRLYYELNVSPLNTVFDAFILNGRPVGGERVRFIGLKDFTCDGLVTKVAIDGKVGERGAKGWSVEYAIPFQAIVGGPTEIPQPGEQWFINLFRIDALDPQEREYYSWVPPGAVDFHRPWRFGILKFD